jgi:thioredoxin reductase (NADPH)
MSSVHHRLIIIGSGLAGLTAGMHAAQSGLAPLIIAGPTLGGNITRNKAVKNWPGHMNISGLELTQSLALQAEAYGAVIQEVSVVSADLTNQRFALTLSDQSTARCDALIIASGTTPSRLNCPGEKEYEGRGVYTSIPMAKNFDPLVIVGDGNTAAMHALRGATGRDVYVLSNNDELRAGEKQRKELLQHPNITVLYDHEVICINGDGSHAQSITVTNGDIHYDIETACIIRAIGATPNTALFGDALTLTNTGHIAVKSGTAHTSIPGVFAAGDITNDKYHSALTSAAAGWRAAVDAKGFLK